MNSPADITCQSALTPSVRNLLLELSDDRLILGHRLSEWCGLAPTIEEDIALANIALDLIGHANNGLSLVATDMGSGATADSLAFLRDHREFKNIQLVEQPNGDFAYTMVRQFFFDAYSVQLLSILSDATLHGSEALAGWASKCHKEDLYHLRHSSQWILRMGDGTTESKNRAQDALNTLWRFTAELCTPSANLTATLGTNAGKLAYATNEWKRLIESILAEATLSLPKDPALFANGGRAGKHTEHLSHLLAVMQSLPRSYPNSQW